MKPGFEGVRALEPGFHGVPADPGTQIAAVATAASHGGTRSWQGFIILKYFGA